MAKKKAKSATAKLVTSNKKSDSRDINALLGSTRWTSSTLTFSFASSTDVTTASKHGKTMRDVTPAAQAVVRWALTSRLGSSFSGVSGLTFTEAATSDEGTIRVAMFDHEHGDHNHAFGPNKGASGGDVFLQSELGPQDRPIKPGSYAWLATLHELGHALGLKHANQGGGVANVALARDHDSFERTIMTAHAYVGAPNGDCGAWEHPQSLMMYDIAAIQQMYGARFEPGSHTYSWSETTGEEFIDGVGQGTPGKNRVFMTVWDGGGDATYDFSNYKTNLSVDLNPGAFSILSKDQLAHLGKGHDASGNVYNALQYNGDARSLIHTAIGGSGDDVMLGNARDNILYGNAGNDTLSGGLGDDTLWGGAGADIFKLAGDIQAGATDTLADFNVGGTLDVLQLSSQYAGATTFGEANGYGFAKVDLGGETYTVLAAGVTGAQLQAQTQFV